MRSRGLLLSCVTTLAVLTISGVAFSNHSHVAGPIQEMDYDVTTDVLLGMPNGLPPLTSYVRDHHTVELPADLTLSSWPPDPCFGAAQVWNTVLADKRIHNGERTKVLGAILQTMASDNCAAQVVRDETVSPPRIVSVQPIPAP